MAYCIEVSPWPRTDIPHSPHRSYLALVGVCKQDRHLQRHRVQLVVPQIKRCESCEEGDFWRQARYHVVRHIQVLQVRGATNRHWELTDLVAAHVQVSGRRRRGEASALVNSTQETAQISHTAREHKPALYLRFGAMNSCVCACVGVYKCHCVSLAILAWSGGAHVTCVRTLGM